MKLFDLLTSVRLTLFLLLGLSLAAVFGTFNVPAPGRYEVYFQSPWFRLGLSLLALNMAACTLKTIRRNRNERRAFRERLVAGGATLEQALGAELEVEGLEKALREAGYRLQSHGEQILAERGRAGRWGSTLVHLSVLVVMAGGLAAGLGFVGTLNIYVDHASEVILDWKSQTDRELGFTFRLDEFEAQYYPIDLQISAYEPDTGRELRTWTTREGEFIEFAEAGLGARVLSFDPYLAILTLELFRGAQSLGEYRASAGVKTFREGADAGVVFMPTGFRDPVLKQTHSRVTLLEQGEIVAQGEISINHPLVYNGIAIYQTAFDRDAYGFWYAGFQFSRDPGKPLVWAGCITLMLGLLLAFLLPYRVVGLTRRDGIWHLAAIRGFSGESGDALFARLVDKVTENG